MVRGVGTRLAVGVLLLVAAARPAAGAAPPVIEPPLTLDVLATIAVDFEHNDDYDRTLFAAGSLLDSDGCPPRAAVLRRDAIVPVTLEGRCTVVGGAWFSHYDAVVVTEPGLLELDHVVALAEAWGSGAWSWTPARRAAFANDLSDRRTLRVVTGTVNREKANKDPSNWIPPDESTLCQYLSDWVAIKARWGLSMDPSEHGRIRNLLTDHCPRQRTLPWPELPHDGTNEPALAPAAATGAAELPLPPVGEPDVCDPAYPEVCIPSPPPDLDCADISHRRFVVLVPDPHNFDGDHNGVGCERE